MIRAILTSLFLLCQMTRAAAEYHPKPEDTWPLVAKAEVIVTGTLDAPVEQIRSSISSGTGAKVYLNVRTDEVIRGGVTKEFSISWHAEEVHYSPSPEQVMKLNGRKVLLFLFKSSDEGGSTRYCFAGSTPHALVESSDALQQRVRSEILVEQKVLAKFEDSAPPVEAAMLGMVRALIDATTRKESQMEAFGKLEALGWDGVPAMILLMDDRRKLAIPEISLENKAADHFEGVRYYDPEKVVDALAAILNQITGEDFGMTVSGGTEEARKDSVAGWRMFLYYWKKDEAGQARHPIEPPAVSPVEASDDFRASLGGAGKLTVYEGLPHPRKERDLMLRESKREDVISIAGYSFYTPAVPEKEMKNLRKLLSDPKRIALFRGPKLCDAFHPDYAIVWESGGKIYRTLICFGCHEIWFLEGGNQYLYDLDDGPYSEFRESLSGHAAKRPSK